MNNILGGEVYSKDIDGFSVTWESNKNYRHWCIQQESDLDEKLLLVMLNPGSLSKDGSSLSKDTTLRIIREVFQGTGVSPFIINLFDLSSPKENEFFQNWEQRDYGNLIYPMLNKESFKGVIYAYGDCEYYIEHGSKVKERIKLVRNHFSYLNEVKLPTNSRGTPKHPGRWQREKIKPEIRAMIIEYMKSA